MQANGKENVYLIYTIPSVYLHHVTSQTVSGTASIVFLWALTVLGTPLSVFLKALAVLRKRYSALYGTRPVF